VDVVPRRDPYHRRVIRVRTEDDIGPLVGALATVAEADGYPTRWPADPAGWIRSTAVIDAWVAVDRGDLLGHVNLRWPGDQMPVTMWRARGELEECAVVSRLFVVPAARRRGLGLALLDAACGRSARLGRRPVLDVVDDNRAAVAMYRRLGWIELGRYEQRFYDDGPVERLHCFAAPPGPGPPHARRS
jgi:GNAT superfamily N-acetyltransferase